MVCYPIPPCPRPVHAYVICLASASDVASLRTISLDTPLAWLLSKGLGGELLPDLATGMLARRVRRHHPVEAAGLTAAGSEDHERAVPREEFSGNLLRGFFRLVILHSFNPNTGL